MSDEPIYGVGQTVVGNYRDDNQDSIRLHLPSGDDQRSTMGPLFGVADGMGGYAHGGIASNIALDTFFNAFYNNSPGKTGQSLRGAAQQANAAVMKISHGMGSVRMGTTLTVMNIVGNQLHFAHIGDSRLYLVRNHKATCLTNDHTQVAEMVRLKLLSPNMLRHHEQRSILNRCVGMQMFVQADVSQITLEVDDTLILCTDGVWSVIEDEEFAKFVHKGAEPEQINTQLIEEALARDSDDNASAITVRVRGFSASAETSAGRAKGSWSLGNLLRKRPFNRDAGLAEANPAML
jgi:PPM family protein phosphatase